MREAARKIKEWREDPVKFVVDVFNIEPDTWQAEVLRAFPKNQRIALQASKGPGKTFLLSCIAWNFISTRPHPKIAACSISADNLADNLWPEMSKLQKRSEFLQHEFEWTKTRIYAKAHPETWFMSARTFPKTADKTRQADTLAGFHADYLLFLMDESGGIPDSVAATAEAGLATGIETHLVQAGNPTHLEGPLYRAATNERHLWWVKEISGDPDDPNRAPRVSIEWARQQIEKYGRDNPWVLVNVFGKFPPSSLNTLLGPNEVQEAMKRHYRIEEYGHAQKRIGVDCSRFGDDSSVIFKRQGLVAFPPIEMRNARSNEIAARIISEKHTFNYEMAFIDETGGYGSGVIDALIQAGDTPTGVNASGKPTKISYYNKRAECWWEMAEWVKRGGAIPAGCPELAGELTIPTYTFKNGKLMIEPKDQIKERLQRSPDRADALSLTFAIPELPAQATDDYDWLKAGNNQHDYDPLDPARWE